MTTPTDDPGYSIGELAELGGVSRRTVRYYVQRGLLEAPAGAGRGSRYSQRHLDTLIRIRKLQEEGVPLSEVPARLSGKPAPALLAAPESAHFDTWMRLTVVDGVELHLRDVRLDSRQARTLSQAILEIIRQGGQP